MKKILTIHLAFLAVILISLGLVYNRYWNVATVNGVAISRLDYIKAMEKLGGQQTLESMIDETLILNEGKSKNVSVDQMAKTDLERQIRIKKIEEKLSTPTTEITQAQIDEFLKTNKAMLPTGKTKEELQTLAKDQLMSEASQSAATTWMDGLRSGAKIVYK